MTEDEFDEIIKTYPYPIASIFSRLGTVECLDPGDRRLNCILDTAEAVSRFLCALVLCLCRDQGEKHSEPAPLNADFLQNFKRPSWGHWMEFSRDGLKWLAQRKAQDPLALQLAGFFFEPIPKESPAIQALGRLLITEGVYRHYHCYAGVATLVTNPELIEKAKELGLFLLTQQGDHASIVQTGRLLH